MRRIRGSGLYAQAALLNHDCLPCLARCDDFDSAAMGHTQMELRAMTAVPAGEELTLSYFPLAVPRAERQARCRQQYNFECACPRCQVGQAKAGAPCVCLLARRGGYV